MAGSRHPLARLLPHATTLPYGDHDRMRRLRATFSLFVCMFALSATGCVLSSGPNCSDACDKAVSCEGLDSTFALNCAPFGACYGAYAECAICILDTSCKDLIDGDCDPVCAPQQP